MGDVMSPSAATESARVGSTNAFVAEISAIEIRSDTVLVVVVVDDDDDDDLDDLMDEDLGRP